MPSASSPNNPYDSPRDANAPPSGDLGNGKRRSFVDQAAKFSLYSPVVVVIINAFSGTLRRGDELARQGGFVLVWLCTLMTIAALILGIVGLVGGVIKGRMGVVVRSLLGVLINGGMIYLTVSLVLRLNR